MASLSDIKSIVFNGKPTKIKTFRQIVKALSDEAILAEKGGYIFSLHLEGDTLHIGILPYFIGDERSRHYDIEIPESPFNLIGFVNADTSVEVFFKPSPEQAQTGLDDACRDRYREQYIRFALFLVEQQFPPDTILQTTTQELLRECRIFPEPPDTIGELAARSTNIERLEI